MMAQADTLRDNNGDYIEEESFHPYSKMFVTAYVYGEINTGQYISVIY